MPNRRRTTVAEAIVSLLDGLPATQAMTLLDAIRNERATSCHWPIVGREYRTPNGYDWRVCYFQCERVIYCMLEDGPPVTCTLREWLAAPFTLLPERIDDEPTQPQTDFEH